MTSPDKARTASNPWRSMYWSPQWRAIKKAQLEREPWCAFCLKQGKHTPATVCDHTEPHRGDPVKFFAGPFQSLCGPHHNSTKQRMENGRQIVAIGADGWPTD